MLTNLTPNVLENMYNQLVLKYPVARAVWIVDMPIGISYQFHNYIEQLFPEDPTALLPTKLPVREWRTGKDGNDALTANPPWFINYPGFWVEMSDGNHYQIVFPRKERGV